VYIVGQYESNPLTIYNADGIPSGITLTNDAGDVYVVKYNTSGTALWATRIAGANNAFIQCAISVDSAGNAYVTSASYAELTIYNAGGGTSGIILPGSGNIDTFIVKYNTNGIAQWATQIGGSGFDSARSITVDGPGNVYVTGFYGANPLIIYNAGGGASGITVTRTGTSDAYLVKYNTSGTAQWATHFGGSGNVARGFGISVDGSGSVYIAGSYFAATVTFYNANGNPSGITLTNGSTAGDALVVKYNTSGTALWASRIDGSGDQRAMSTSVDGAGNVYVTGVYAFSNPLTIYNANGSAFATTLTPVGGDDVFVVKYNTSGTAQWVTQIAGTGGDIAYGISVDSAGNSYVTGSYGSNPVTIYNAGGGIFGTLFRFGTGSDVFVVKYDTDGIAKWATRIAGSGDDISGGVSVGGSINSYITGTYLANPLRIYNADTTEFGILSNSGFRDVFIVKYA
jgi:outer membrane protein assembly factor BamB